MKKLWLMGGFGNVLFQVLAARVIRKTGNKVKYVDLLTKDNILTRMLRWKIHQQLYSDLIRESELYKPNLFIAFLAVINAFLTKKLKLSSSFSTFYSGNLFQERTISENVFGYFQESEFLLRNKSEINLLGRDIHKLYTMDKKIEVVVHYRKGDSNWASDSYYEKTLCLLKEEKDEVIIVTDSLDAAKDFFRSLEKCKIIRSPNALDDFKMLVSAKKLYCAPSTFSWWAAHALDPASQVVFPKFLKDKLGVYTNNKFIIV